MTMTTKTLLALGLAAVSAACGPKTDPGVVTLNGRLEAPLVDLAPKVAGRVITIAVREGDRVKAGDLLIQLDLGDTALAVDRDRHGVESARARLEDLAAGSRQAEIASAEAELADRQAAFALAEREMQRQTYLLERQVGAPRDYDHAKTELDRAAAAVHVSEEKLALTREGYRRWQTEQARSEMNRAQTQLQQSQVIARESDIRAPADGIVMHKMVERGQLLAAGQTGITLALTSRLYVRTFVPETKLGLVRHGQTARVFVDAFPGEAFEARVAEIAPEPEYTPKAVETKTERINLVYGAKVDLDQGWAARLVPGQPADVHVQVNTAPSLASNARQGGE